MPLNTYLRISPIAMLVLLSACGGGGSDGVATAPPPPTTPTTPPPPPPPTPTTNYDTAEYRRSNGAHSINAIKAYDAGATGVGINVGVIDSGINAALPDFAGRVHGASADVAGNSNYTDEDGHGTAVAGVIAANRNDTGHQGVAFNASLVVMRADKPGSCATEDPAVEDSGCAFLESAIANGIDNARLANAKVINLSLGGEGGFSTRLTQAIARATSEGIIIVVSAGNDGETSTGGNPDGFATDLVAAGQRGLVIIAGALDTNNNTIAGFSNRAGSGAGNYITALGTDVRTIDHEGKATLWSGTSFSAPVITGAIALIRQAFPNLTPEQVVQLVYSTARDLGTPGVDNVYGRGGLDLTRAFQPVGTTSLAGTPIIVGAGDGGSLSEPLGDGGTQTGLSTVVTDSFGRAFTGDINPGLAPAQATPTLWSAMQPGGRRVAMGLGGLGDTTLAVSVSPSGMTPARLNTEETRLARAAAASLTTRMGRNFDVSFGFSQSANALVAGVEGKRGNAFLISGANGPRTGFASAPDSALAASLMMGKVRLTAFGETGDVLSRSANAMQLLRGKYDRNPYTLTGLTALHKTGPVDLSFGFTQLNERGTILGARLGPLFGQEGASTQFVDASAQANLGHGWVVGLSGRHGWTSARQGGVVTGGTLKSRSWALDVAKAGLLGDDKIAFRYAEPLRVYGGGLHLWLPNAYDYATSTASFAEQRLALTPSGRARDWEAAYTRAMWGGNLSLNGFYRTERANIIWMPDETGAVVSYSKEF